MRQIQLTQGKIAIVDDEDYDFLMQWKWHFHNSRGKIYAVRAQYFALPDGGRKQKSIRMHVALMPAPKGFIVDHKNGDSLDNRKANLRICTQQQNTWNRKSERGSSSKYKGVTYYKINNSWAAYMQVGKMRLHLGCYLDEDDAARAYNAAAKEHHGEFAVLNPVPEGICTTRLPLKKRIVI